MPEGPSTPTVKGDVFVDILMNQRKGGWQSSLYVFFVFVKRRLLLYSSNVLDMFCPKIQCQVRNSNAGFVLHTCI